MRRAIAAQARASSRSSGAAPGGGAPSKAALRQSRCDEKLPAERQPWFVRPSLDLLRLGQRPLAVQAPERHFGMDFERARGRARVVAQASVHLPDFRRDHEQLLRDLPWRIGGRERRCAGLAILRLLHRGPRGHREHRRLSRPEQRADRILGCASAIAGAVRQADRHVDCDDAGFSGRSRCRQSAGSRGRGSRLRRVA